MRVIDIDQKVIVPICDEALGTTYEEEVTIAELLEGTLEYQPEIIEIGARVLTYDEARENAMRYMNPDAIKPLVIEYNDDEPRGPMEWRGGRTQRAVLIACRDGYGRSYRYWTDVPTDAQRKEAAWDEEGRCD